MQTKVRPSDYSDSAEKPNDSDDSGLMSASADLIKAIQSDDQKAVAAALRAAFQILDSEPHEEGPHTEEQAEE